MSLVSYEYSGSEEEEEDDDEEATADKPLNFGQIFASLPAPKHSVLNEQEERVSDLLETDQVEKSNKKEAVKIQIPSLENYSKEEEKSSAKIKVKSNEAGLFSILPPPKSVPNEDKKFNASILKQKNLIPRVIKANTQNKTVKRPVESDEEDNVEEGHYLFSSVFTDTKIPQGAPTKILNVEVNSAKPVTDIASKSNQYFADLVTPKPVIDTTNETESLDEEAIKKLCGKSNHKRQKGNKIEIVDVNAADALLDPREWRTKALTEEAPASAVKKGEEPSLQSRRKHQITYLAHQAKANEQELKNRWAMNRMSRKQTQAKYGF